jgi:ferric-dicitrate binding protein FerR (iron transport regulator)
MNRDKLIRFFEGTATHIEEVEIRHWMGLSAENVKEFHKERALYDATLFSSSLPETKKRTIPNWLVSAAAAVIASLVVVGSIKLLTGKGSVEQSYSTLIVPPGQRVQLVLSDNSKVWVNANSKFSYPNSFDTENRTVFLEGEAYFEVKSDKKNPFIVKTSYYDVRATGTSFNVEAYSRSESFETALFEGKVDFLKDDNVALSLKSQEKVNIENGNLRVSSISDNDKYLWRRGLIAFNDAKLEEILLSLEKYFDVKIVINTKNLPSHTYSGKLRQSDGVDYALRVLQRSIRFKYERDEITGTITIN